MRSPRSCINILKMVCVWCWFYLVIIFFSLFFFMHHLLSFRFVSISWGSAWLCFYSVFWCVLRFSVHFLCFFYLLDFFHCFFLFSQCFFFTSGISILWIMTTTGPLEDDLIYDQPIEPITGEVAPENAWDAVLYPTIPCCPLYCAIIQASFFCCCKSSICEAIANFERTLSLFVRI